MYITNMFIFQAAIYTGKIYFCIKFLHINICTQMSEYCNLIFQIYLVSNMKDCKHKQERFLTFLREAKKHVQIDNI